MFKFMAWSQFPGSKVWTGWWGSQTGSGGLTEWKRQRSVFRRSRWVEFDDAQSKEEEEETSQRAFCRSSVDPLASLAEH